MVVAEEECTISDAEVSKIDEILSNIDDTIYDQEYNAVNDNEECAYLLTSIHTQLRRMTQKYKLMNKGYVKVEEFRKMAQDYDTQLVQLKKQLEQFKKQTQGYVDQRIKQLQEKINGLEQNAAKLQQNLTGVLTEYGKVQKDLCITYLETNQITKAKTKAKQINSRFLIELIEHFLKFKNGSVLPVIDLSAAIPDLDDRGEVYKTIYSYIQANKRLETEDSILLEAEVLKMNASLKPGSNITDDRKKEILDMLQKLTAYSEKTFNKWTEHLNHSMNMVVMKNVMDHLFGTQMKTLGDKIGVRKDFYAVRNLLKLLALSNNYHKIAAYKALVEKQVGHALAMVWFDMRSINFDELKDDPHNAVLFNDTYALLPNSLRSLDSCTSNVNIFHIQSGASKNCIVASQNLIDVKHPNPRFNTIVGKFKEVVTQSSSCTRFRLEPTNDRSSVKIVSPEGNALTNINSAVPGETYYSQVGAPYTNGHNMKLDSSQDWILEANRDNDTIKIESEFDMYQTGKSIDHLLVKSVGGASRVVVGRYGFRGLTFSREENLVGWEFKCAT